MRVTRHAYAVEGWGVGELWEADGRLVVAHDAPEPAFAPPTRPRGTPGVPTETLSPESARQGADFVPELLQRIHSFYRGEPVAFADVPLDLDWCTPFQRAVAEALRRVPWGEVVSYAELAALAGYPRAHRAVGTFCAHNRYSLFLPCHRVVASGGIGSYGSGGVALKRRLLTLEGHAAL
ncbi:MAG TPA: methylated-DNA--[protein]-cysteine S-methyltransferase [Gaiellaceae bacterium]|nr:methylated-DNA--[protein]-cysteine S-methyltransferase [Gaiellaceae bacterium]